MKNLPLSLLLIFLLGLASCYDHRDHGPRGLDGRAYYSVDYSYSMPYSYWDSNPTVPANPYFGEFYRTEPGYYEFEYFVNPSEYWYGSYQIQIQQGGPGGAFGQVGEDGLDTYLTLFLDPQGWSEDRFATKSNVTVVRDGSSIQVDLRGENELVSIKMTRTTIDERPTSKQAKFRAEEIGLSAD